MEPQNKETTPTYGIPKDIYYRVKMLGVAVLDIFIFVIGVIISLQLSTRLFPPHQVLQKLMFIFLTAIIMIYLLLPSNGGKKNWQSILIYLLRRKKRYISMDKMKARERDGY